jgi:hypothetical protein
MAQIIEVPGMGEVEFPDDMTDEQIVAAIRGQSQPARTTGQEVRRQLGLTGRAVVEGAAAIPLAAADFGVGARNLLTGGDAESPSSMFAGVMDRIYGKRETPLEQGVGIAGSALAGAAAPVPQVKVPAPATYTRPLTQSQQVLRKAQAEGMVVPPATANPTAVNKVLEGVAGKLTTGQAAAAKNQSAITSLSKRALGLPDDSPLTMEDIIAVRKGAEQGKAAVRGAGRITRDGKFAADLGRITARYRGAAKDYPDLAKGDVDAIVKSVDVDADASSAVDAIAILRENADDAFRSGKGGIGKAYKDAAKALEDLIDRNLAAQGKDGAAMLNQFRAARTLQAKTYTVEKAFNSATGQVSGTKLGQQAARGKPLSGDLETVGKFAQAFPKAAREFNESLPGISPLDFYATGGVAGLTREPWYLVYPFVRQGVRNALLSPLGQKLATPPQGGPIDPRLAAGMATGAGLIGQQ